MRINVQRAVLMVIQPPGGFVSSASGRSSVATALRPATDHWLLHCPLNSPGLLKPLRSFLVIGHFGRSAFSARQSALEAVRFYEKARPAIAGFYGDFTFPANIRRQNSCRERHSLLVLQSPLRFRDGAGKLLAKPPHYACGFISEGKEERRV